VIETVKKKSTEENDTIERGVSREEERRSSL
jgi:hypothetical protein